MARLRVTVWLDKVQLARVKKALGAETVTEAIEWALALAIEKAPHDTIIRKYSGAGGKTAFGNWRSKPSAGKSVAR